MEMEHFQKFIRTNRFTTKNNEIYKNTTRHLMLWLCKKHINLKPEIAGKLLNDKKNIY